MLLVQLGKWLLYLDSELLVLCIYFSILFHCFCVSSACDEVTVCYRVLWILSMLLGVDVLLCCCLIVSDANLKCQVVHKILQFVQRQL